MKQIKNKYHFNLMRNVVTIAVTLIAIAITLLGTSKFVSAEDASNWKVDFKGSSKGGSGIELYFQGIPIIYKSTMNAVKPGWTGYFYRQNAGHPTITKDADGTLHVIDKNADFHSEYELRPVNATTFRIYYRGELLQDAPAQLELNLGYFNANVIAGRAFTAVARGTGQVTQGKVVTYPAEAGLNNNDLSPGFETLSFDSRLGKMTLKVETEKPILFADARNYPILSDRNPPIFWLGQRENQLPLKKNHPVEAVVTITIEPQTNGASQNRPEASFTPQLLKDDNARNANIRPIQVVPQPKQMTTDTQKYFLLKGAITSNVIAPKGETRLVPALRNLLEEEWNATLSAPVRSDSTVKAWSAMRIGSDAPASFRASVTNADWATHPDAYQLTVDNNGILIIAPSARGVFYGVQTLAQLLRQNAQGELTVPFTRITDWSTLEFRGIHWTPQPNVELSKNLIHVAARYKYNYAILDFRRFQWKFLPAMSNKGGIDNTGMKEVADAARANFLDPIPLLNGPGHATWLFQNGQNSDLREDPKSNHAYSVNNPRTFEMVQKAMSEIIDAVKPDIFHIGADEFNIRSGIPNPNNPYNTKDTTIPGLFSKSVRERHDWLAQRHIKTMMWGDQLIHKMPGERSGANASTPESGAAAINSQRHAHRGLELLPRQQKRRTVKSVSRRWLSGDRRTMVRSDEHL